MILASHTEIISQHIAAPLSLRRFKLPFSRKYKNNVPPRIYTELNQPDLVWTREADDASFVSLVEHVRTLVLDKINKLTTKIMTEEALPKGFEYWSRR